MTEYLSPRRIQAQLAAKYPAWEVWYVPLALGGMTWCARRGPHDRKPLHASRPEHLDEYLAAA